MRSHRRIGIHENNRRLTTLNEFRKEVEGYFLHSRPNGLGDARLEDKQAHELRVRINRRLDAVGTVLRAAGIAPAMSYRDPPMIRGRAHNVDLILNVFNLTAMQVPHNQVLDCIDRGIGVYEANSRSAWVRTCVPVFWLAFLIEWVAGVPFALLGRAGFDQQRIEQSTVGKLFRFAFFLAGGAASIATLLEALDLLETVRGYIR